MTKPIQVIMIDNYDSFTYNLVDQFRQIDCKVVIFRNDTPLENIFTPKRLEGFENIIVISPGPGNPDTAGNTLSIIKEYADKLPILGICLGHQSIVQQFGGEVGAAQSIVHGKADQIKVEDHPIFEQMGSVFQAARYHSLVAVKTPSCLKTIASTHDQNEQEVMAVVHEKSKIIGLQFHPESILTTFGKKLLSNCINWLLDEKHLPNEQSV